MNEDKNININNLLPDNDGNTVLADSSSFLHPQDPIRLMEQMKDGAVRRWARAIDRYAGKSIYEITITEWINFRKEHWYRCVGLGCKSLTEFDEALKNLNFS